MFILFTRTWYVLRGWTRCLSEPAEPARVLVPGRGEVRYQEQDHADEVDERHPGDPPSRAPVVQEIDDDAQYEHRQDHVLLAYRREGAQDVEPDEPLSHYGQEGEQQAHQADRLRVKIEEVDPLEGGIEQVRRRQPQGQPPVVQFVLRDEVDGDGARAEHDRLQGEQGRGVAPERGQQEEHGGEMVPEQVHAPDGAESALAPREQPDHLVEYRGVELGAPEVRVAQQREGEERRHICQHQHQQAGQNEPVVAQVRFRALGPRRLLVLRGGRRLFLDGSFLQRRLVCHAVPLPRFKDLMANVSFSPAVIPRI
jgi:hypothetical protein